ncbi:hypothetical protein [Pseudoalteromonas sp. JC3]|uniref:hypothetical protein n=1 Tax=Pseudoalteromonas sp. JC3 TaxID=2810196 RepID=UPI0019D111E9|nr:hypothetical protein [Pseudoalteromonas sp. JC3]MBR8842489.1 hypothetical protein [Pseudoalteromonas sp. JC3]WJE09393.1 hypothetical protein QSH61_02675 [Pseudoalteromonas sp. JC3]
MKLGNLLQIKWAGEKLKSQIGYYDERLYCITDGGFVTTDIVPKIVILARKFYTLRTKDYTSISKQELGKILELQKKSSTDKLSFTVTENSSIDGFTVVYIELKDLPNELESVVVYIPETELFNINIIAEVTAPESCFYVGKGTSVLKGGLISNFEAFKFSIGETSQSHSLTLDADEYASYLLGLLSNLEMKELRSKLIFNKDVITNPFKLHLLYYIPLLSVFITLLSTFGWNEWKKYELESKNESLSVEVSALLDFRDSIDANNDLTQSIVKATEQSDFVHPLWDVLHIAMTKGFYLDSYEYDGNSFEISGHAKSANEVLKAVSGMNMILNASFRGGVRKIRGDDHFTIRFQSRGSRESN